VSPSALLKHELAYCLGQSGKPEAVRFLEACVEDRAEDDMCRHEAAEALGALGFDGSLELLKARRDDKEEVQVVRETAELAVERIEWAASDAGKAEKLRSRYVDLQKGRFGRANLYKQRFRIYRPCATSCRERRGALNPRLREDTARHIPPALPALQSYVRPA
jgi:hypothetical protein